MRNERNGNSRDILRRWCSSGQSNALVVPERRKFRRVHGLQLPLHPQQVTGWIVILIIVVNTFAILTPLLEPNLRPTFSIVIAAVFLTHICSHLTVLLLDPADPRVRSQPTNKVLPEFDRRKHSHVIENGRCHLCNITTESKRTKHCSICNKCIVRFDHHCKWLNNCIGARNYRAFLVCLISAILASLFVAGLSATELSFSLFTDRLASGPSMENNTTDPVIPFIAPASDTTLVIAISAIGILSAIVAILLLHLCFFHGYIACLGLTTYEYVRNKREKNSVAAAVAIAAAATAAAAAAAAAASTASGTAATAPTTTATTAPTSSSSSSSVATTTTVTTVTENASTITIQQMVPDSSRLRYGFCEFVSSPRSFASSRSSPFANDANLLYSRRGTDECTDDRIESLEGKPKVSQAPSSRRKNEREKRNFRLCFSTYELEPSRLDNHSEITTASTAGGEISTDATDVSRNWNAATTTDLSTPSPVFCCFATLNSALTMHCCVTNGRPGVHEAPAESKKRSSCDDTSDRVVRASANSCETVERIGRFLRTYLSKGKRRRRCKKKRKGRQQSFDVTGSTLQIAKSKGLDSADFERNRTTIEDTVAVVSSSSQLAVAAAATATATATDTDSSPQTGVPLPIDTTATAAPPSSRSYLKPSALHRSSLITEFDLLDTQQNRSLQKTLGPSTYRRPSTHFFLRRGQKAKMNSQIITQSIKLSPILESELSKPVTPRSTHSSLSSYSGLSNRSICSTSSSSSSSQVAPDSLPFHEKCEIHRIE